jgi:hypothetical protein
VPTTWAKPTTVEFSLGRNRKLRLARPQGSASASGGNLRLARPQGSASASGGNLRLAQPQSSASASGGNLRLARPQGSTSASEESPPRPTSGLDQPRHEGCIITLLLASSGYEGTRPASHQSYPGNRRWWFPACNHDVGDPQAPYGSKIHAAPTAVLLQGSRHFSDGHGATSTGLETSPRRPHCYLYRAQGTSLPATLAPSYTPLYS